MVNLEKDEITEECMQIWHLYREYIKSFCSFQLKDCPDCVEDCVQDVFMALLEARRAGKEIKNPKAWLTRVANNKIIDEYKNKAREAEHINRIIQYETALKISAVEMPQLNDISDELIDEMTDNILNRLKADERSLVEDYYMKEYESKRYRCHARAFRDKCPAKALQSAEKDSAYGEKRDRETKNLKFFRNIFEIRRLYK